MQSENILKNIFVIFIFDLFSFPKAKISFRQYLEYENWFLFSNPCRVEWVRKRERHWKIEKPCFASEGTGEKGDIKAKHLGSLSIRSRVNKNLVDRNPVYFSHKLLLFVIFAVLNCRGEDGGVAWDVSKRQSTFGRERVSIVFVCDRIVSEKQIFFLWKIVGLLKRKQETCIEAKSIDDGVAEGLSRSPESICHF